MWLIISSVRNRYSVNQRCSRQIYILKMNVDDPRRETSIQCHGGWPYVHSLRWVFCCYLTKYGLWKTEGHRFASKGKFNYGDGVRLLLVVHWTRRHISVILSCLDTEWSQTVAHLFKTYTWFYLMLAAWCNHFILVYPI